MKKEFNNYIIEYTEDDLSYIDECIELLNTSEIAIMDFFKLKELDKKVNIKF